MRKNGKIDNLVLFSLPYVFLHKVVSSIYIFITYQKKKQPKLQSLAKIMLGYQKPQFCFLIFFIAVSKTCQNYMYV